MAKSPANGCDPMDRVSPCGRVEEKQLPRNRNARTRLVFWLRILLAPLIFAQSTPQVTGGRASVGKVNDTVTVSGQNLGKDAVSAVFLSDDKNDYKADSRGTNRGKNRHENSSGQTCQLQMFRFRWATNFLSSPVRFTVEQ